MPMDRSAVEGSTARWVINKTWRFHRSVDLNRVEADDSGIWAYISRGADVTTFDISMSRFDFEALVFFPRDRWWNAMFLEGAHVDAHIDITMPATISGSIITTVDLALDVIIRDGNVQLVDLAEFDEHRVLYRYPAAQVHEARQAAREVQSMIADAIFPFDGGHGERLNQIRRHGR
ncbi:MAG: DUF402 domain-containing protein [Ilumatobacteraceae bacterium]